MGVHGLGMAAVPLLALVFGGKNSSGIMLIILCFADILAVGYYNRHANWSHLFKLFPWAALGVLLGAYFGDLINDGVFKAVMAVIILVSLPLMVLMERGLAKSIPQSFWFAATLGVLGGFTSMIGNLAGSVMALYLLSMNFNKNEYIGTTAWFFMVLNWFKIPFHIWAWHTISLDTFLIDLMAIPMILLGAFLGVLIVRKIPEKAYRWFIISTTVLASLLLLF